MGIRNLNRFFKNNCGDIINLVHMSELSGKKIAIDISIYMYKYAADNSLIENMYLMLSVFRIYNIIPIFIFDGKPPQEKRELLLKRRQNKRDAENEYNKLKTELETNINIKEDEKNEIINNMDLLKKQFIYISKEQINNIKNLIRCYGATYFDAPGESDELCAQLVIRNKVWACLSEDMDMFVYGCSRVLRYFSLLNHTAVLYDINQILDKIGISQKHLREICVLSGTDYNENNRNNNNEIIENSLYKTIDYFKEFYNLKLNNKINDDFYNWLIKNTNYINNYEKLKKIYSIFDLNNKINNKQLQLFNKIDISNGPILYEEMKKILAKDGFIFPKKMAQNRINTIYKN